MGSTRILDTKPMAAASLESSMHISASEDVESSVPSPSVAQSRAEYVRNVLTQLANRHRLRVLTVLYNAPSGLEVSALAALLDGDPENVQPILDRLTKAGLVSVTPVLDDETLGWMTRYLVTPAARDWLERVALANGREAIIPE